MSFSPNSSLVQHTIDLTYNKTKRSSSLKWIVVNGVLFMVFSYDLWYACPGHASVLHWVEAVCAAVLLANAVQHAARLVVRLPRPAPTAPRPAPVTPPSSHDPSSESLSPRRWRADSSPPPSPPSPASPPSPPSPRLDHLATDEFIADRHSLTEYLRGYEERTRIEPAAETWSALPAAPLQSHYQLAAPDTERAALEENGGEARSPQVWRRLQLDPQRLTQWTFNLRLWLHVTILERLVREMERADVALRGAGLEARVGQVGIERLAAAPPARPLLPYLQPFADQRYVVQRIRELAAGGCMSAYRWNGGGASWDESKPTDAELVLHLLCAYLDAQLPASAAARSFSAEHVSSAPAPPPRGARALAVHRVSARPPHYVLVLGEETLEAARGRNNLLHTVLLLLAAAARRDPPALRRMHLGSAGLNMLWIIGR